jgi:adenosylcobinamide kinase / adenosylcobinamide-phosphate guanylyltransferase
VIAAAKGLNTVPHLTLILGGARSGKSRQAEALVMRHPAPWTYIATSEATDDEMRHRIAVHKLNRGEGWRLLEAPVHLDLAVRSASGPILIDCLTLWLVVVSNEVGLGNLPDHLQTRRFRDQAGWLNQRLAACADTVLLIVAGLPMRLK